jgi:hypothetical protein
MTRVVSMVMLIVTAFAAPLGAEGQPTFSGSCQAVFC